VHQKERPRILVVARGHLGDILGALPALRSLRQGFRDAHITVIANEYVRGALEQCPFVDEVIYGFSYRSRSRWQTAVERLQLVASISGRYDVALSLRMGPRSGPVLGLISGAGTRVGYRQPGLAGRLLTHDLGPEPRVQANRITNAAVVDALGLQASPEMPRINWVPEREREAADRLLAENGIAMHDRFAVLQVAAHWGCYEWRNDKWATVADHLAHVRGLKVVVVGTRDDFEMRKFADISALTSVPVSLQGLTTLPMLFHIVARASLVVASDSAITQVAIAQRVPSVILFGIEPEVRNGPLPSEAHLMETIQYWEGPGLAPQPNTHCLFGQSHCHTGHCRENSSFQRITPREVCDRVDRLLTPVLSGV
jgi:ADP-heptose:LPS heptosyltransferase